MVLVCQLKMQKKIEQTWYQNLGDIKNLLIKLKNQERENLCYEVPSSFNPKTHQMMHKLGI